MRLSSISADPSNCLRHKSFLCQYSVNYLLSILVSSERLVHLGISRISRPNLLRLSAAGNDGNYNPTKAVLREAPTSHFCYESAPLPISSKLSGSSMFNHACLWPQEFFNTMYHFYTEHLFTYNVPSADQLVAFWRSQEGTDINY